MANKATELQSKIESETQKNIGKFEAEFNNALKELEQYNSISKAQSMSLTSPSSNATNTKDFITNLEKNASIMNRKKMASDLSSLVLNNPSCKAIQEWFSNFNPSESVFLSLLKADVNERYFSKAQKKMVITRNWSDISAIQAAPLCGDNFVLMGFLSNIINVETKTKDSSARLKAAQQLQEALENPKYLISFKELIESYKLYFAYRDKISCEDLQAIKENEKNKWFDGDEKNWKNVAYFQQRLSCYGLQEFCDPKSFYPIPNFKTEPCRDTLHIKYQASPKLNLDALGQESLHKEWEGDDTETSYILGLLKGTGTGAILEMESAIARQDLATLQHLCNVRTEELKETIKALQSYDESVSLINRYQENQKKNLVHKM